MIVSTRNLVKNVYLFKQEEHLGLICNAEIIYLSLKHNVMLVWHQQFQLLNSLTVMSRRLSFEQHQFIVLQMLIYLEFCWVVRKTELYLFKMYISRSSKSQKGIFYQQISFTNMDRFSLSQVILRLGSSTLLLKFLLLD